jgi:hypothetical protein
MTTATEAAEPAAAVSDAAPRPGSRADRASRPRAMDVLRETAVEFGVCVRPLPMRRVDPATGEVEIKDIPCGATRAVVCPSCAARARKLRAQQCRDGWHLTEDPDLSPRPATAQQRDIVRERAQITAAVQDADDTGDDLTAQACRESAAAVDDELTDTGVRGTLDPDRRTGRRVRSTRRRLDTPDLPRRPATATTLGRVYTDERTGKAFRPSLFVTLTLPSYGRVRSDDSTPVDPAAYDYARAARDALHFGKLLDRWCQNLRRVAGYDVQYFATVEPQKRAAPHAHFAIRGTLPRAVMKQLTAATYGTVWWPATETVVYGEGREPRWDPDDDTGPAAEPGGFVDPDTGAPLLTWQDALDQLDDDQDDEHEDGPGRQSGPRHVIRFGQQVDVQGVLAGSPEAERLIGYAVKYLVKDLGEDLIPVTRADREVETASVNPADARASAARRTDHVTRLVEALRWEPCSPSCPNWLRYGIQPKNPRATMRPGCCKAKAHKPTHLGYGGRRVLVSRKWTGKDLADHRHDRRAHVLAVLGSIPDGESSATMPSTAAGKGGPVLWERAKQTDSDVPPLARRLLVNIAHATRWRTEYRAARDSPRQQADPLGPDPSAPAA